ncbi:MAG: carbohydrate binding domain-containing protein, partial [Candidatus Magasanikbacteria bacterium]|nr:carbohydrate binding domain-containing protein [Candidatus Magasanikbacteria bacterium]
MKNIYSKSRGVLMGVLVLAMIASGVFFRARPALAIPVEVLADVDKTMNQIKGGAFAGAFLSGMQYFINKIAYDSAVWLASGGKGQKPLLFSEPGKYFGDVAKDAAGEALANLNNLDFLKKAGINLCMPPDINLRARIKLDIANGIFGESTNAPVSKCRWDDIAKAYEKIGEPGYWSKVGIAFEPGQNDLSVYMAANNAIKEYSLKKERAARDDAAHKGDTLTPVDPVTGKPTVSKEVAKTEAANSAPSESAKKTEAQANALTPSILDGTWGALILGAKTFTNTLASQLMQRLTTRGFFSGLEGVCYLTNNQQKFCPQNSGSATEQGSFGGKTTAALAFADLLTPKIYTVNDYDGTLMAELGACDAAHRGLYSCAADGSLLAAVSQAKSGKILTVQQAIDQGYLHKDWQLMPPGNQADNQDPYCFSRAYCYSNLIKLRQVNILPVGWELAAQKSNFKQPYTLDFFVKNFNNKNTIAFHLIDPNWLIKLPPTQCKARVFGQFLASAGTADRAEYCADVATCVNEDENGNCSSGQYGYCRQTKNIWHLGGETCPAQFNTCTALVSRAGEATAYVANTINKGVCDASNVGCRAYSNTQKFAGVAQGDWEWQDGNAQLAYFNKDAQSCSADAEGCTRFIRQTESVRGADLNLRKAPDYYKCYAGNATPPGTQSGIFTGVTFSSSTLAWPANHTDLVKLENSLSAEEKQQCGRFAQVCAAEENGCEAYAPANGDPQITGNLSASDLCPQECVGYESFIQQSSFFEPVTAAEPQKYFIPSTGESCNADNAGCDEFVNIEKGGEQKSFFTELHLCSKNPADGATYYTWEGSDTTGYQLKSYVLKKDASIAAKVDANIIGDGKGEVPAYLGSENSSTLSDYAQRCNKDAYANRLTDKNFDTDCREFYDKDGHISYRLWSKTITVDPQGCQKLRKSVSFGANTTERAKTCAETYGTWEVTTNTCVYLAIPSEANTCSAQFNGCRAYKGNGGNNYQIIDTSTFEQATLAPWSGGILSAESTTQGGHSVKIAKKAKEKVLERVFASSTAQKGTTYLVSFWAKGTAGKELKVGLYQGGSADGNTANIENKFALSNNWGVYTAGPFTVNWDKDDVTLAFKPSDQSSDVFVDTISVRKMQDMVYLMRNSWDTPASCDNPLTDSAGLSAGGTADAPERTVPQAMLGCAAYTDRAGKGVSAKSFTNICRAEAVGCEEVKDTHNTQSDAPLYSNAICWLPKQGIGKTFFDSAKIAFPSSTPSVPIEIQSANYTNLGMPCKDAADETLCIIQPGAEFCRFNWSKGSLPTDGAKTTAVFKYNGTTLKTDEDEKFVIKTDGQTQKTGGYATVYLVNDSAYYCAQDALGCAAFGQRSWVATSTLAAAGGVQADYATTYIK